MKLVEKMELQTVVKLDKPSFRIDYSTRLMMLGSCFVENVGAKLFDRNLRFAAGRNPVGHFQQLSQRNEFSINLNHRQGPFPPAAYQKNYTTKLTKNHNFPIK